MATSAKGGTKSAVNKTSAKARTGVKMTAKKAPVKAAKQFIAPSSISGKKSNIAPMATVGPDYANGRLNGTIYTIINQNSGSGLSACGFTDLGAACMAVGGTPLASKLGMAPNDIQMMWDDMNVAAPLDGGIAVGSTEQGKAKTVADVRKAVYTGAT